MEDPFATLAERYNASGVILRQIVRHTLVDRQLREHLPPPPARIVDVGGGAGQQTIPLARDGYEVTILDPSPKMLAEAGRRLDTEENEVRDRVKLVEGFGERTDEVLGGDTLDAALCHGVLMYLDGPRPMIGALANLVRPGGVVSILAKNASALAVRPALERRYRDALKALRTDRDPGRMGVVTRGDTVEDLRRAFEDNGLEAPTWYGIRVFVDHLGDALPGEDLPEILELEWEAGRTEPYRSMARLIHLVASRPRLAARSG